MPKFGLPQGGGQPIPTATPGVVAAPPQARRGLEGLFPERGSQSRHDLVMEMVRSGMSQAQGSNSPLLAFLAPMAGAAIGSRSTKLYEDAEGKRNAEMGATVLGKLANNPEAQGYMEVLNNPNAPDHMKSIASARLERMLNPPRGRGGAAAGPYSLYGDGRPPGNTDQLLSRLLYTAMDPNGDGGATITPGEQSGIDAVRAGRSRYNTDLDLPAVDENAGPAIMMPGGTADDPLGVRNLPPA